MSEHRGPLIATVPISPAELLRELLQAECNPEIVTNIVVGPATHEQQQEGVVTIVDAGLGKQERYLPLIRPRAQIRIMHQSLAQADVIARHVFELLYQRGRTIVFAPSSGHTYLIHQLDIAGGPSMHYDTPETWETLIYVETLIGLQPVS